MKYQWAASAEADLHEAMLWYESQSEGLGKILLQEVEAKLDRICNHPLAYPRIKNEFRKGNLDHFPYSIVYRITTNTVEIAAVFHMSSSPSVWHKRLR